MAVGGDVFREKVALLRWLGVPLDGAWSGLPTGLTVGVRVLGRLGLAAPRPGDGAAPPAPGGKDLALYNRLVHAGADAAAAALGVAGAAELGVRVDGFLGGAWGPVRAAEMAKVPPFDPGPWA